MAHKLALCFLFAATLMLSSCHVGRFFIYNFADIRDHRKFPAKKITKSRTPFMFAAKSSDSSVRLPRQVTIRKHQHSFDEMLDKTKTVAFLVIRNDTLLYEKYLHGYSRPSVVPSFSVAKSFTSVLVGIAIDEDYIADVMDPVIKYIPELKGKGFDQLNIQHLLDMRSGIKFNEGYTNPFGDVAKYYYGRRLKKYIPKLEMKGEPDSEFEYLSVNTQLLGMIVERATKRSLADYMEEKVWQHIGAEYDATWSIDSRKGDEVKAFCCFNARPLDFAKMGRLYLHNGNWNGRQVVSEEWVRQSLDVSGFKNSSIYSYQWWHNDASDFFAQGLLGQYVYVYPAKHIIIVRLGKNEVFDAWPALMRSIAMKN